MQVFGVIAEILKAEGVDFISCFPSSPLIDAVAAVGIRPIVCRQERVGVGIADGFSRVTNGRRIGVFAMQYGPGSENAYAGVATAYSDSVPILVLPLGHARSRVNVFPHFSSSRGFAPVTKWVEEIRTADEVTNVMRRAFSYLKMGRPGPVMVEIPVDVGMEEVDGSVFGYRPTTPSSASGNPEDVAKAVKAMLSARNPIILAGQGVLYAEASPELVEFAELLTVPVMATLEGKSAFPEDHELSLGSGALTSSAPVTHFLNKSDMVIAVGSSLTRHGGGMVLMIPPGKVLVQVTNDWRDINKDYRVDYPILGDAKLVLRQLIQAIKSYGGESRRKETSVIEEITGVRERWLNSWMPKLTSDEVPINPYRVIWEFMKTIDPKDTIVTHDSGSPRDMIIPFYRANRPRGYLGWGKSHALGTGLGLIMGAKLADPGKFCVNFMGDAAFGMTGLDFETAVRCKIPITTIILNNSIMGSENDSLTISHERYSTRYLSGNYAEMAKAMGGYAERVTEPSEVSAAIDRARKTNDRGQAALLEFITSEEHAISESQSLKSYWV